MWNDRYSEPGYAYGVMPNDFLVKSVDHIPEGRVLCLAEGEGRNAVYLALQGFDVTAVDSSEVGLEKAERLASDNGVSITTILADLNDFDLEPNTWSGIISIFAHVPAPLRKKIHENIRPSLITKGVFILEAYTPAQLTTSGIGGPNSEALLMTKNEIISELGDLYMIISEEITRQVNEGKYHSGESAVLQVLAQKTG